MKKAYIETYGCQMNVNDTEVIFSILAKDGYERTEVMEEADLIMANTCSIRDNAEQRIWGRIEQFNLERKKRPGTVVGIVGVLQDCKGRGAVVASKELLVHNEAVDLGVAADRPHIRGHHDLHIGNLIVVFSLALANIARHCLHIRPVLEKDLRVAAHRHHIGRDLHHGVNLVDSSSIWASAKHGSLSLSGLVFAYHSNF